MIEIIEDEIVIEIAEEVIVVEIGDAIVLPEWGMIRGVLANQTDLQTALDGKSDVGHYHTWLSPIELTDEDLNQILPDNTTFYYAGDFNTVSHSAFPAGTAFGLMVFRNAEGYRCQVMVSSGGIMASRVWRASVWSQWQTWVLDGYSAADVDQLLNGKSDVGHNHDDRYYTEQETDTLLSGKANTADLGALAAKDKADWNSDLSNVPETFPPSAHDHDGRYYTEAETDALLSGKSDTGHVHDDRYYTEAETDALLSGKSDTGHTHDDRYYTEAETDALLAGKSDTGHTHDDRYYTEAETDALLSGKSDVITKSASGDVVSFSDGADAPVVDLTAAIEPVQVGTGDPSPENVRPISGWTGCNVVVSPTTSAQDGTTYPVSWQSEAGTVYGGTLDVTTGVLTVTHLLWSTDKRPITDPTAIVTRTDMTSFWLYAGVQNLVDFEDVKSDTLSLTTTAWEKNTFRTSSSYPYSINIVMPTSLVGSTSSSINTYLNNNPINFWLKYVTPLTYQLTPIEVKTLLGNNNLWSDTGRTSVIYITDVGQDISTVIEREKAAAILKDTETRKMITESSESSATATKNYTAGSLMIVNNSLLRATANIANGGAITIGSNAEEVDVEELLTDKADVITKSASGDIVTIDDGADAPVVDLTATIELTQSGSGDPSPENVRPISGWTGCNVVVSPTDSALNGTTYSVSWQSEAGIVYGGTLDVTTGVLTVTHGSVDLGAITYTGTNTYRYFDITGIYKKKPGITNIISDCLKTSNQSSAASMENYSIKGRNNDGTIFVKLDGDAAKTSADFQTFLSGHYAIYELDTPLTYQLTPTEVKTILGLNNIWADTGSTNLTYITEAEQAVGTAIENAKNTAILKDSETRQMITESSEPEMIATKNYVAGKLMIINNTLLRATANIANGGAITIGSNAEEVDLETLIEEKENTIADTGWVTISTSSAIASGALSYRRIGSVVYVRGYALKTVSEIAKDSLITVGTIPEDLAPNTYYANIALTQKFFLTCTIQPKTTSAKGKIYLYTNDFVLETTDTIYFTAYYFLD